MLRGDSFSALAETVKRPLFGMKSGKITLTLQFLVLGLAAILRLSLLNLRPPSPDEGIDGCIALSAFDSASVYRSDVGHGPLHFYLLAAAYPWAHGPTFPISFVPPNAPGKVQKVRTDPFSLFFL